MTFPRTGCHTCKIRRIKCDDTKPTCQRCMKSQRICLGSSAKKACFEIHLENCYASGATKRPRGPRSTLMAASTGIRSAVLRSPQFDLQTRALAYYLHCHLQTLSDMPSILKSLSDCVPEWMTKNPMVDLAISSMAMMVFSRTQQYPPAATDASAKYQQVLQLAQVTIPTVGEKNIDACLLAIFLMSRYEDGIHRPSTRNSKTSYLMSSKSFSHHDGAKAILKIWKDRLSCCHPATEIIKQSRRGVIRSAILRNIPLPEWMEEGSLFGEHGLELDYDRIIVRIVNLRHQLSTLLHQEAGQSQQMMSQELFSRAEELNEEAQDIDQALEDWEPQIPSHWYYQRHSLKSLQPLPQRHFFSSTVYSYSSLAYAFFWNRYFSTRMLMDSIRLRLFDLGHPEFDNAPRERKLECFSHMKIMADKLASSIPFCLQRFKIADSPNSSSCQISIMTTNEEIKPYVASLTVWPLTIAACLEDVEFEQKLWFKAELAHVGRVIGAGVLECADNDQWLKM